MVQGDGAGAEENEGEGEGGQGQGEFVSAIARQSIVEVNFPDGHGHVNADGKGRHASEQTQEDEQAAKEFSKGRKIGRPGREAEAGDELGVVVKSTEDFVVSVDEHDRAQGEAHNKECEGLQAIEVAHLVPPAERK
jgi:hypothetical protein